MRSQRPRLQRTSLIIVGCIFVLLGLGLARITQFSSLYLVPAMLLFPVSLKSSGIRLMLAMLVGLNLGWWQGTAYMQKLAVISSLSGTKVTVSMVADSDAVYSQKSQLEFDAVNAVLEFPGKQPMEGKFKVSGFGPPMVYKGDTLSVTGKLYSMRGSRQARMSFAKIEVTGSRDSWYDQLRRRISAGMLSALPEPDASLGLGLLIGQRSTLPAGVLADLTAVGLVHIVAVSGYNVTILARGVARLKLSRSKFQQFILSIAFIGSFVLITGFSASIVRAALVSLLSLWAWYFGRRIRPIVLIAFVAAVTAMYNPFYVWSDIGWYLSFLAFFGVLIVAPLIAGRIAKMKNPGALLMLLIETLSAELATLPLLLSVFGHLSLVSLLANAVVVPVVPVAMLLGAVAGTAGALLPGLAGWIAWPAKLVLDYMLSVIRLLAGLPYATVELKLSTADMLAIYMSLLFTLYLLYRRHGRKLDAKLSLNQV